ncbi:hypothetical protein ACLIA0_12085 [Bacillaceae bacterium W0354]
MKKNLLVIYHNEIENEVVLGLLLLIAREYKRYSFGKKINADSKINSLLSHFVLVTVPLQCIDYIKELIKALHISGLETCLVEGVVANEFKEVIYKTVNKMAKISVTDNVQLFEELENVEF